MITESFLDLCFNLLLSKSASVQRNIPLTKNISEILQYHNDIYKGDIPVQIKNKFNCLQKFCEFRLDNRDTVSIVDSLISTGRFTSLKDYIEEKLNKEIEQSVYLDFIKQVRNRKKEICLFKDFSSLKKLVENVEESKHEGIDDIVEKYEYNIKTLYANMMEENRVSAMEISASLDLLRDSYSPVLKMIKESSKVENSIPSGFNILDKEILKGGFKKRRLYLIGGSTGSGKSTFLINILSNLISDKKKDSSEDLSGVYVYITLENLIDETFCRLYCCNENKTEDDLNEDMEKGINIENVIREKLKRSKNNICFYYFPAFSVGVEEIRLVLDDVSSIYGKDKIKGIFIDYLDLLDARFSSDLYRLQLGKITLDFKILAIDYDCPVISVTQVNRSGYNETPDITSMGEAIKKAEHSDFVGMFGTTNDGRLSMMIRKNRNGPKDRQIIFMTDLSKFKMWPETTESSPVKFDSIIQIPESDPTNFLDTVSF